jgi:hypothetical protein
VAHLASDDPRVGVVPCGRYARKQLLSLMLRDRPFQFLQCTASFFSVQHVLEGLQRMPRIPFATELVHFRAPKDRVYRTWDTDIWTKHAAFEKLVLALSTAIKNEDSRAAAALFHSPKLAGGKLDDSQQMALFTGLSYRTAFIQGPPGSVIHAHCSAHIVPFCEGPSIVCTCCLWLIVRCAVRCLLCSARARALSARYWRRRCSTRRTK